MDKSGVQIQATMFNVTAEKYKAILNEGSVYEMSGGDVKMANKKFTSIPHDFCLTFNDGQTDIKEVKNVQIEDYKGMGFNFKTIK